MESIINPTQAFSMLLVEDEAACLELLAIIIPKKFPGALLHTANNGRAGLDLFKDTRRVSSSPTSTCRR